MKQTILAISGSASSPSSNARLLETIAASFPEKGLIQDTLLRELPLYRPELDKAPLPAAAEQWRAQVADARAVIISTPEYLYNIPAMLKNGLEWLKSSGELYGKAVLPITFTPHPPRGEHAMESLRKSLQALEARIVAELPLYQSEVPATEDGTRILEGETRTLIEAGLDML
ncbi:MAG: NADPH-dependent FMN reductase [Cryomorphaceae bacterium]